MTLIIIALFALVAIFDMMLIAGVYKERPAFEVENEYEDQMRAIRECQDKQNARTERKECRA